MNIEKIYSQYWDDYELIDAGGGKKLERWGKIITIRPEVQAYFKSELPFSKWEEKANFEFVSKGGQSGNWKVLKKDTLPEWQISREKIQFQLELTKFKHVGLFPEQSSNWEVIHSKLNAKSKFLNLFAYTGAASLVARSTGAETIHVDSVKHLISWARKNQDLSQLENTKWVHEDALKFAEREVKRGNKYDGIIMDPPAWGIGAKGEKWKLEDKLETLISLAKDLLSENGFLILNTYSPTIKTTDLDKLANRYFKVNKIQIFELWMKTSFGKDLYYGNGIRINTK